MKTIRILVSIIFSTLLFNNMVAQTCNDTIGVNTMQVKQDTFIVGVNDNYSNYLVCQGVTLTYRDNSQFETVYLEPGANLILDSSSSYGYVTVYSKAASFFDANNCGYGQLIYEAGSMLHDTSNSFYGNFFCSSSITYDYSLLPGLIPCSTLSVKESVKQSGAFKIQFNKNEKMINLVNMLGREYRMSIYDISGKKVFNVISSSATSNISISSLRAGIYFIRVENGNEELTRKIVLN